MASISLDNIRKVYGGSVEAVKGISLDIADGDLVVLVGPSGCGKSTLLRMVAGLEEITSGTLKIGDRVVNRMEPAERDIAMVFQNYALYPHMTVYNNLAYGLKNRGQSKQEIDRRVQEAAKMLEIGEFLERKPRQLSGGQRQRVAMGRALVREPAAFLFDEPLSNLDAKLRVQMRVEIKALQKRLKTTSLYVTHDQVEAMTLADTLVVMNAGVAEQIGRPIDIYTYPASTFVAEFIGSPSMNLLPGTSEGGGVIRLAGGQSVTLGETTALENGRPVLFGVRPEHLEIAEQSAGPALDIAVNAVETLGADTMAHGMLPGANGRDARLIARLAGNVALSEGDRLSLAVKPGMASVFDVETGRRINHAGVNT